MMSWFRTTLFLCAISCGSALLAGCNGMFADYPMPVPGQACQMKADQADSLWPPIDHEKPLQIEFGHEMPYLLTTDGMAAAGVWNAFSRKALGRRFFQARGRDTRAAPALNRAEPTLYDERCSVFSGSPPTLQVFMVDSDELLRALELNASTPATTVRCFEDGHIAKQAVFVNGLVVNGLTAGPGQFMAIMLHELGHVLGLGHSCAESGGTPEYRSCDGLDLGDAYRIAVMYPTISGGNGLAWNIELTPNDMERAYCLYLPRSGRAGQ